MNSLPTGIYTPLPCFFKDNEDLDLDAFGKHVAFVAKAETIPVISGTMGEAIHLDRKERTDLISTARQSLDDAGLKDVPIVAGVGGASTRESIELAKEAHKAGADFGMAIAPGYYSGTLKGDLKALQRYFIDVAESSPIPIIIYNFPGVSGGIDLDSDFIVDVVKAAPNVCGVKLTCANVGKLARITAQVNEPSFQAEFPRKQEGLSFRAIDGFIDFLLPSVAVGAGGAISGLPNIAPKACVKLWHLCQSKDSQREALELQNLISLADGIALKIGIAGMKKLLNKQFGYGELPRRPLTPMSDVAVDEVLQNPHVRALLDLEATL